jgi:hypothetical protein
MSQKGGFQRTLPAGSVLWWQGDPASSLAVVEKGCMGVRADGRLLDVAIPGTVLGEASLLTLGGTAGRRTADVVALQADSEVVEHPVASLSGGDPHVPATVLRTLFYQVARNVLLVRAARPADALVVEAAGALAQAAARAHRRVTAVSGWDEFLTAFRFAYRLRECSDVLSAELAPAGTWTPAAVRAEVQALRGDGFETEIATAVEGFIDLWSAMAHRRS